MKHKFVILMLVIFSLYGCGGDNLQDVDMNGLSMEQQELLMVKSQKCNSVNSADAYAVAELALKRAKSKDLYGILCLTKGVFEENLNDYYVSKNMVAAQLEMLEKEFDQFMGAPFSSVAKISDSRIDEELNQLLFKYAESETYDEVYAISLVKYEGRYFLQKILASPPIDDYYSLPVFDPKDENLPLTDYYSDFEKGEMLLKSIVCDEAGIDRGDVLSLADKFLTEVKALNPSGVVCLSEIYFNGEVRNLDGIYDDYQEDIPKLYNELSDYELGEFRVDKYDRVIFKYDDSAEKVNVIFFSFRKSEDNYFISDLFGHMPKSEYEKLPIYQAR